MAGPPKLWQPEDIELLIKTVTELRLSDPEPSLLQIIKIAQDVLPPEKRKYIATKDHAKIIIEGVKKKLGTKPLPNKVIIEDKIISEEKVITEDKGLNKKIEELSERVARLESLFKKKAPKIVLVGYMPDQFNRIEKEIGDRAKLLLVETGHSRNVYLPPGDYCIFTTFTDHKISNQFDTIYGKDNVFRIDSAGKTKTIDKILELIRDGTSNFTD